MAVITISRQYGSGGNQIAALLCQRLGYRYFDKELMKKLGAPTDLRAELEAAERAKVSDSENPLFRLFRGLWSTGAEASYGGRGRSEGELAADAVEELIRLAYQQDNVVIVGRGGQTILKDKPDVLHVRVVAPAGVREQTIQQFDGVTADVAAEKCAHYDRAAVNYVRQHYGVDPSDASLYDMIISTAKLTPAAATDAIMAAAACLPRREGPGVT